MPGNEDTLNTFRVFASDNGLDIPLVRKENWKPDYLIPHRTRIRIREAPRGTGAVHFFLEDYRFEPVWKSPGQGISYVRKVGYALTPDFSLYANWPLSVQLWNVYRNRWCGAYWQSEGIRVIPTISWSDEDSFPFCFLGVEKGSTVAISTVGVAKKARDIGSDKGASQEEQEMFRAGYRQMLRTVEPEMVLVYGDSPERVVGERLLSEVPVRKYPSRWHSIRQVKRDLQQEQQRLRVG